MNRPDPHSTLSTPSRGRSRRSFLTAAAAATTAALAGPLRADEAADEPIIDIHQHTHYSGRTNEQLIAHQRALGVSFTVLLPAGRTYGLEAECNGNASVLDVVRRHPRAFTCFANEIADLPGAPAEIARYLKRGAIGIGEQKFRVTCDSPPIRRLAELAREYRVPMLLHFQHGAYNTGIENFHQILAAFPDVNFIGHAQTWWGNIDKHHRQEVMYPKGPVTPGGITDQLLTKYPNMYGDLSAGSGLNALQRDEDHARRFIERHQNQLLYGSDCNDTVGHGPACSGSRMIATLRRLAPTKNIERKLLYGNAKRLLKL